MAKNVITINGKQYDAHSGALLVESSSTAHKVTKPKLVTRQLAHHVVRHAPKPSETLMRKAVKKPTSPQRLKTQGHLDKLARQPLHSILAKHSVKSIDSSRLSQAKRVHKSRLVSRFSTITSDSGQQTLAVQPEPKFDHAAAARASAAAARQSFILGVTAKKPKTTAELLDYALQQATAHQQPYHQPVRRSRFKRLTRVHA